jgi:serine/threonine-protein kinase
MEEAPQHSSLIGATIGNYRVVAKLGEGGMGAVYLAEHPLIGKKVALKVLHEEYAANQDVVSRFFNEAKAVNDIGHPNIVDIIDFGMVQTGNGPGFVYFIMEFLGGESLSSLIMRESPVPWERAFHIATQVADALLASHGKGIIHRDLKPDNIYLIPRGREKDFVKVLDFGIAKLTGDQPGGSRKTRTGIVMGTPAYMSPEQCEGRGNIDNRTDVYALGIVLYEILTGSVPFGGEGYGEVLVQHLTKLPPKPTTIHGALPPVIEAVLMRSLEKKREDRYLDMEQYLAALRDPQGFVDAAGGLEAFIKPTQAGSEALARATSYTGVVNAPTGTIAPLTRAVAAQRPTTLTSSTGEVQDFPVKSKTPMMAAAAAALFLAVGGGTFLMLGGKKEAAKAEAPAAVAQVAPPAAAPAEAPAAAQPAAPQTVKIIMSSSPMGADVFVGSETASRGKTPLPMEMLRAAAEIKIVLKLDGYKDKTTTIQSQSDGSYELALDKLASKKVSAPTAAPRKPADKKGKSVGDDDVLAPSF